MQVPQGVLLEVLDKRHEEKYRRYAMRSFVEDNRRLTWCPGANCDNAVESLNDAGSRPLDVACKCGHSFCFICKEEAHRPVSANSPDPPLLSFLLLTYLEPLQQ